MSDGTFTLKVFSGRGLEVDAQVRSVNVPSETGELGFLPNHCDYVGLLSTGLTEYVVDGETGVKRCVVSGGLCTFADNVLTLLADSVDLPGAVEKAPVEENLEILKTQLETLSLFDPEWEVISQRLARAEAVKTLAAR
jgi:F0F1-type ATP synthase epsilon subunit